MEACHRKVSARGPGRDARERTNTQITPWKKRNICQWRFPFKSQHRGMIGASSGSYVYPRICGSFSCFHRLVNLLLLPTAGGAPFSRLRLLPLRLVPIGKVQIKLQTPGLVCLLALVNMRDSRDPKLDDLRLILPQSQVLRGYFLAVYARVRWGLFSTFFEAHDQRIRQRFSVFLNVKDESRFVLV